MRLPTSLYSDRFNLYAERPGRQASVLKGKTLLRWLAGHKVQVWAAGCSRWTVLVVKDLAPDEKPELTANEALGAVLEGSGALR